MEYFVTCRGSVYSYTPSGGGAKQGFYALSPALEGAEGAPIILNGAVTSTEDVVALVNTLSSKKLIYPFATDFSRIAVHGTIFLGAAGDSNAGKGLKTLDEYVEQHRVVNSQSPISVSMPGSMVKKMYLLGCTTTAPNVEFHTVDFTLTGIIVEPK